MRKITLAAGIGGAAVAVALFAGVANASSSSTGHSAASTNAAAVTKASVAPTPDPTSTASPQHLADKVAETVVWQKYQEATTAVSITQVEGTKDYLVVLQEIGGKARWLVEDNPYTSQVIAIKSL